MDEKLGRKYNEHVKMVIEKHSGIQNSKCQNSHNHKLKFIIYLL